MPLYPGCCCGPSGDPFCCPGRVWPSELFLQIIGDCRIMSGRTYKLEHIPADGSAGWALRDRLIYTNPPYDYYHDSMFIQCHPLTVGCPPGSVVLTAFFNIYKVPIGQPFHFGCFCRVSWNRDVICAPCDQPVSFRGFFQDMGGGPAGCPDLCPEIGCRGDLEFMVTE